MKSQSYPAGARQDAVEPAAGGSQVPRAVSMELGILQANTNKMHCGWVWGGGSSELEARSRGEAEERRGPSLGL